MEDLRIELSQYGEVLNCENYEKYFLIVINNWEKDIEFFNNIAGKYLSNQKICTLVEGLLKSEYDWNR
jgi:hypothetical protein